MWDTVLAVGLLGNRDCFRRCFGLQSRLCTQLTARATVGLLRMHEAEIADAPYCPVLRPSRGQAGCTTSHSTLWTFLMFRMIVLPGPEFTLQALNPLGLPCKPRAPVLQMLEARSVAMTAGMSAVSRGEFVIPARM